MRIVTAHDLEGNIHYVVVSPSDAPLATVNTEAGLLVTEVEPPKAISRLDLKDAKESRQHLAKVLQNLQDLRVEVGEAKLIRAHSKSSK